MPFNFPNILKNISNYIVLLLLIFPLIVMHALNVFMDERMNLYYPLRVAPECVVHTFRAMWPLGLITFLRNNVRTVLGFIRLIYKL